MEVFGVARDQHGFVNLGRSPNDGIGKAEAVSTPQLHGSFSHSQVKRDHFKLCIKKLTHLGVIVLSTDQDFHPCDTANEHAHIAAIFGVSRGDAI